MPAEPLRVAVAIATFGRPESCRRLVEAVLDQDIPDDWQLRTIVVNNDPAGGRLDLPRDPRLEVLHEPEPGVPFARNRGVAQALPWADVLTFIDDDELPVGNTWLRTLVRGLDQHDADVVSGPVMAVFPEGVPAWISGHPLFQRRKRRSGERMTETYTGNTAVRSSVFGGGRRFHPAFRYTGGEDTQFFRSAYQDGIRIRWVAEAIVEESIPADRACIRWILARSFRVGGNRVQFARVGPTSAKGWIIILLGSAAELLIGLAAPIVAVTSRRYALVVLGRAVRGIGSYAALFGAKYEEYR